jgi:hypothetical protein
MTANKFCDLPHVSGQNDRYAHEVITDPAAFDAVEVDGCREVGGGCVEPCEDEDAQFWSAFAHRPGAGRDCIGDFLTREGAEAYAREIATQYRLAHHY